MYVQANNNKDFHLFYHSVLNISYFIGFPVFCIDYIFIEKWLYEGTSLFFPI